MVLSSRFSGAAAPSDTIGRDRLSRTENIADAIRHFAGVQIRDFGGVGGLKTVNVRSLGSEHTGVYLDGVRIGNAQNMQVDLGRFSTEGLERIEVYGAVKASLLQSASEYGVANSVHLMTARPDFASGRRHRFSVRMRGGSFLTFSPALTWEVLLSRRTSLRLGCELTSSQGRFRFRDRDTVMIRRNCDLRAVRAEAQLFGAGWTVRAYFYDSERGIPGPVFKRAEEYPLSIDRQADRDAFLQGEWGRTLGIHSFHIRGKFSYDGLRYLDAPEEGVNLPSATFRYRQASAFASLSWDVHPASWCHVGAAGDFSWQYLDANLRDFVYPSRYGGFLAASATLTPGRFKLVGSLLYHLNADAFGISDVSRIRHIFSPSLAASWGPHPAVPLSVNVFIRRTTRLPSFNDLYYTNVGVKDLRPETALQTGGGLDIRRQWGIIALDAGVDAYWNRVQDKILAVPSTSLFRWQMSNVGKVSIAGTELKADLRIGTASDFGGLTLRYTFQQALNLSDPQGQTWRQQIPYIPLHSGSALLYGQWKGWRADLTAAFCGERYTTSVNLREYALAPWMTLDLTVGKKLQSLDLSLTLRNLTGSCYQIVQGYPMPGFHFFATVSYSF